MGHLTNKRTKITADLLSTEEYDQLEFEADVFAGEVLASKWLMRQLDIVDDQFVLLRLRRFPSFLMVSAILRNKFVLSDA